MHYGQPPARALMVSSHPFPVRLLPERVTSLSWLRRLTLMFVGYHCSLRFPAGQPAFDVGVGASKRRLSPERVAFVHRVSASDGYVDILLSHALAWRLEFELRTPVNRAKFRREFKLTKAGMITGASFPF